MTIKKNVGSTGLWGPLPNGTGQAQLKLELLGHPEHSVYGVHVAVGGEGLLQELVESVVVPGYGRVPLGPVHENVIPGGGGGGIVLRAL